VEGASKQHDGVGCTGVKHAKNGKHYCNFAQRKKDVPEEHVRIVLGGAARGGMRSPSAESGPSLATRAARCRAGARKHHTEGRASLTDDFS